MGKHSAPVIESSAHPWLRRGAALASITIMIATAIGGGAVYAINGLGRNINSVDTSDLNNSTRPISVIQTDTSATNLLVMGSDSREGLGNAFGQAGGARSDTTLLVHLYEGRKKALVVSIPRDSWVEIAGCIRPDGSTTRPYVTKFNAAFAFGGPVCTIKTIEKLTDIRVNNFVVVDFKAFKKVVDALGGVEVCLTTPAYDPVIPGRGGSGLNLPAGYSTITGKQALAFVRARETLGDGSDLSRIKRQQEFIGSMIRGMEKKGMLTNPAMLYRVLAAITTSITTNPEFASVTSLQNFALSLGNLDPANIQFVTIPYSLNGDGNVHWNSQTDELWKAINAEEVWPKPSASPSASASTTDASPLTPAEVNVTVLNATGSIGLAKTAAADLQAQGFNVTKVGNSTRRIGVTEILYKSKSLAGAKLVGESISSSALTKDNTLASSIVVLVGPDWHGAIAVKPSASPTESSSPSPTPTDTTGTAASTACTVGNNRVKK